MSLFLAIVGVYFFVSLGFAAKKIFGEIHERTLVLLSVYFLQPILSFWGILGADIDFAVLGAPIIYFCISLFAAVFGFFVFTRVFEEKKDAVIVTAGGVIGNTGNLGIPLLLAMFGKGAALYAVLINLASKYLCTIRHRGLLVLSWQLHAKRGRKKHPLYAGHLVGRRCASDELFWS